MDLHQTCSQPCPWTSWRTQQMYSKIRALPGFCDALALPSTLGKDQHCELRSARRWDKLHTPVLWLFWVHSMINIPGSPQMARTEVFWCVDLFWSLRWNDFFLKAILGDSKLHVWISYFLLSPFDMWWLNKLAFEKYRKTWSCGVPSSASVVSRRCSICRDPSSDFCRLTGFHVVLNLTF